MVIILPRHLAGERRLVEIADPDRRAFRRQRPDIVLMDIRLDGDLDGDLARALASLDASRKELV